MELSGLLDRLDGVRRSGDSQATARCPAHDDQTASLSVGTGDGDRLLIHCHAGCSVEQVVTALGLTMAHLSASPHVVATYPYHDETGQLLWTVERWSPKTFRVRPSLPHKSRRVLFALNWIIWARQTGATVFVVEGEKDCLILHEHGLAATCNVGGAGKWLDHYSRTLRGLRVVVIADNDAPGHKHARQVAESLAGEALNVSLMVPPKGCKDVGDIYARELTIDALEPMPEREIGAAGLVRAADVAIERELGWAWPGRVPFGNLTVIDGDPGEGKSVLMCALAALWSKGMRFPDGAPALGTPIDVMMVSAEDDVVMMAKRLAAHGADRHRVHFLTSIMTDDGTRPFNLGPDLRALEYAMRVTNSRVCTLDPLMAFLPSGSDSYRDQDVRKALHPYVELMADLDAALIVIRHLTKGGTRALYAGGGSVGIIGAARAAYLIGPDPDDELVKVVATTKANYSAKADSLRYKLGVSPVYDVPVVLWQEPGRPISAQALLDSREPTHVAEARQEARDFIETYVREVGECSWADILKAARSANIDTSDSTMRRARTELQLRLRREGYGGDQKYLWSLPALAPVLQIVKPNDYPEPSTGAPRLAHEDPGLPSDERNHDGLPTWASMGIRGQACDVCGTTEKVTHDVDRDIYRCVDHNPFTYGVDDEA